MNLPITATTTIPATQNPQAPQSPAVPKLSLEDAISRMVSVLAKKNYEFSAHDVTKLLREAVNIKSVDLDGMSRDFQIQIGPVTQMTAEIDHSTVKDHVHSLFLSGDLPDYKRELQASDRTNSKYWKYTPAANAVAAPAGIAALNN